MGESPFENWRAHGLPAERVLEWDGDAGRWPRPLAPSSSHPLCTGSPPGPGPVIYWMLSSRRLSSNAGLAVATLAARHWKRPLLILESLLAHYPWASERLHIFFLSGITERVKATPGYLFVPLGAPPQMDARGLVSFQPHAHLDTETLFDVHLHPETPNRQVIPQLLASAALVVSDWNPTFIFPGIARRLARRMKANRIPLILVDDNGIVPLAAHGKPENAARFIRPKLAPWAQAAPQEEAALSEILASPAVPLTEGIVPRGLHLAGSALTPARLSIHVPTLLDFARVSGEVGACPVRCCEHEAQRVWQDFLHRKISGYQENRSHPDRDATSRLSPYLHGGAIHPRKILFDLSRTQSTKHEWNFSSSNPKGSFADELVTWRELGLNMAHFSLLQGLHLGNAALVPAWARQTLEANLSLQPSLGLEELEAAASPEPVWNAAQRELAGTGTIHNHMRMLWGKGIVRWSRTPQEALTRMEYLNNKYALDGRDSNSYLGFLWCLGKFDRPWPPARPPFGLVRSMSFQIARRKLAMESYLARNGSDT